MFLIQRQESLSMNNITTQQTLKYTQSLNILYVEDDLVLQTQTNEFLSMLFNSVQTANDGKEALQKFIKQDYDIIISDIQMPNMNGLELTAEIKKIKPTQSIIITSAYNDIDSLLGFINLNIKQFMHKPVEMDNMLFVLHEVSKNIINERMIESYRKELELTNKTLQSKNDELQSLVRILDSKLIQISKDSQTEPTDISLNEVSINENDLNELKELETDISGAAVLISLSNKLSVANIKVLGDMFSSYSGILTQYEDYEKLTSQIALLGSTLNNAPENFIKRVEDISILLESFIYVLRMWRKNIVEKDVKKAFELHTSMINDVNTIIMIIDGTEDDIEGEMEFF